MYPRHLSASDRLMSVTAPHTTEAQDAALDDAISTLEEEGGKSPYPDTPDSRYEAVQVQCDLIPDYELLAARIAGALGAPLEAGLEGDPLTQMLHDVWSEAQADAEREVDDEEDARMESEMEEAEARARWHAQCDADLDDRLRYPGEYE
jgi:hypothetical protein